MKTFLILGLFLGFAGQAHASCEASLVLGDSDLTTGKNTFPAKDAELAKYIRAKAVAYLEKYREIKVVSEQRQPFSIYIATAWSGTIFQPSDGVPHYLASGEGLDAFATIYTFSAMTQNNPETTASSRSSSFLFFERKYANQIWASVKKGLDKVSCPQ